MRKKFAALAFSVALCLALAGCREQVTLPQPPGTGKTFPGGAFSDFRFLNIICPPFRETAGMIFEQMPGTRIFTIRGMKCTIELSDSEKISIDVTVARDEGLLYFGSNFQVKADPATYRTAKKITITYPGFQNVFFRDVRIQDGRIELPSFNLRKVKKKVH